MFIMFHTTGKRIFDDHRLELIKEGRTHVSNRDYLLSILRGFPQEEADEALKLSVMNRLYRLYKLPVTHVEYIDGHLGDIWGLEEPLNAVRVKVGEKEKTLLDALKSTTDITRARTSYVDEIKDLVDPNELGSLIYTCVRNNFLGLPIVYERELDFRYPMEFLDTLGPKTKAKVLGGGLPSPVAIGNYAYEHPEEKEQILKNFKEDALRVFMEEFKPEEEPYYIPDIQRYVSAMASERHGSIKNFTKVSGYSLVDIRTYLLRAKYTWDDHIKQLEKFTGVDAELMLYSGMVWCSEYYAERPYYLRHQRSSVLKKERALCKKYLQEAKDIPLPEIDFNEL